MQKQQVKEKQVECETNSLKNTNIFSRQKELPLAPGISSGFGWVGVPLWIWNYQLATMCVAMEPMCVLHNKNNQRKSQRSILFM